MLIRHKSQTTHRSILIKIDLTTVINTNPVYLIKIKDWIKILRSNSVEILEV